MKNLFSGLIRFRILSIVAFFLFFTFLKGEEPGQPVTETRPKTFSQHGIKWQDEYFWLRNREDPKVRAHLEAENQYAGAFFAPLKKLRDQLVEEMKSRMVDQDVSVPYRKGDWLIYRRDVAGADYPLLCRKPYPPTPEAKEQILLNLNERASLGPAYEFGGGSVSPDGWLYAWKENFDGTDRYTIHFKNLRTGEILAEEIKETASDEAPVWTLDNKSIFYTDPDEAERPWRVKRHRLGTDPKTDPVVFEEPDARFHVGIEATRSLRFLFITCGAKDTTETSLLPLDHPETAPKVIVPRREGIRYSLADCSDQWFILSNDGAVNGRVFRAPLESPEREHWTEVLPADDGVSYESINSFATHVVLSARKNGVPGVFFLAPSGSELRWICAPDEGAWFEENTTPEYQSTTQRISYQTFVKPSVVADADLATGAITVLKQKAVPAGYDPAKYRVEKVFATARDGARIPIWLLLPVHFPKDGTGGMFLSGYGAYGSPEDPWFDSNVFSLLDRGIAYGIAQVRGGGEFGRTWYEAGKLGQKEHTFSDFIACAEKLIEDGYTGPKQLCGYGASAGGLLAGAVVNMRPDLFRAFIAEVPFVDVLNTMLDPTLPLTVTEYDEWGNPAASREEFDRIRAYSPYDNVTAQAYPAMFALAGWNDTRVSYWEPAKWVARIRARRTNHETLLLSTQFETGHGGASGRYSELEEVAMKYAFLLKMLGRADQ